jgi:hypothetical protein
MLFINVYLFIHLQLRRQAIYWTMEAVFAETVSGEVGDSCSLIVCLNYLHSESLRTNDSSIKNL